MKNLIKDYYELYPAHNFDPTLIENLETFKEIEDFFMEWSGDDLEHLYGLYSYILSKSNLFIK